MNLSIRLKKKGESNRVYVYDLIYDNIIRGNLAPNSGIDVIELAGQLSVSKTPVREALLQLNEEGMVVTYPQSGTIVAGIDMSAVYEAQFMRRVLEEAIIIKLIDEFDKELIYKLEANLNNQKFCIEEKRFDELLTYDDAFHHILFEGSDSLRIWLGIQKVSGQFNRFRMMVLTMTPISTWQVIYNEHKELIGAIRNRDKVAAKALINSHLSKADPHSHLLREKYLDYF